MEEEQEEALYTVLAASPWGRVLFSKVIMNNVRILQALRARRIQKHVMSRKCHLEKLLFARPDSTGL